MPLPLGEVASPKGLTERAHAVSLNTPSVAARQLPPGERHARKLCGLAGNFAATAEAVPLGKVA